MDKINVLIVSRFELNAGYLEDIAAVSPRISVKDATAHFVAELRKKGENGELVDILENEVKALRGQIPEPEEDLDKLLNEAEVIFGVLLLPDDLLRRAKSLKWLHLGSTGIDLYRSVFGSNIIITNSSGALAIPIAEHVFTLIFALTKGLPRLLDNQKQRKWERFENRELHGRTMGLIGLGAIGKEVAQRAKGFGMKVLATRRSATSRKSSVMGIDELYPVSELNQVLAVSNFVVIAVPQTEETKGMIGEAQLRVMRQDAYLINVGRGSTIDQDALIKTLKDGQLGGAGLDVFAEEPLPIDSELWQLPNVIISSHMAGASDRRRQRLINLFCENLKKYIEGEELQNRIDAKIGY